MSNNYLSKYNKPWKQYKFGQIYNFDFIIRKSQNNNYQCITFDLSIRREGAPDKYVFIGAAI